MTIVKSKIKAVMDPNRQLYAILFPNEEALLSVLDLIEISNEALSDIEDD